MKTIRYGTYVTLWSNATYDNPEQANEAAKEWLDRLAERDNPNTWDQCDWEIVEYGMEREVK